MKMTVTSIFGKHTCKDLELVDISVIDDMVEDSTIQATPLATVANDPVQGAEQDTVSLDPETEQ